MAATQNARSSYTYKCGASSLIRPSNTFGGPCGNVISCEISIGLRIRNTLGVTINSISVQYEAYQLSTTQDGNNQNMLKFFYQTGATVTSVTAGTWTPVAALDYTAPNMNSTCGSNQVSGSSTCLVSSSMPACIGVTIPNNTEIMLRWADANNHCNDTHLAIDNITVTAFSDNVCTNCISRNIDFIFWLCPW